MENFYTAKEAQRKLDVSDDKLQYMVRSGQVKKVILPGRKYGMYPKEQVNRLAAAMEAAAELYAHDASVFEQATQIDLPEIYSFVKGIMPRVTPIEKQREWMQRSPEAFYTLRDSGIVVAYACIFPVNHNWLMRVLKDEVRIGDIPSKEIYPFKLGKTLDIYMRDLIVTRAESNARGEAQKVAHYGQRMLFELINVVGRLGERGINIRAVYALATTPEAHKLCQRLRMQPMPELENKTPGYMPYKLDVTTSESPLLEDYKKNLEQYQREHTPSS